MSKKYISFLVLLSSDLISIFIAILISIYIRNNILNNFIPFEPVSYWDYLIYPFPYVMIIVLFSYFGLYYRRYDVWQEMFFIFKICFVSFIIVFATLALGKNIEYYSRTVLILTFVFASLVLPITRKVVKNKLFEVGIWRKKIKIFGEIDELDKKLITSPYIGYELTKGGDYEALFLSSSNVEPIKLNKIIETNVKNHKEILFIPVLKQYDFTQAVLYHNFNARVNLFALKNRLLSKKNNFLKTVLDYALSLMFFPIWGGVILIVAIIMKIREPKGKVFFLQERLGKNGKVFYCYKFRTMISDQKFMQQWLIDNPHEKLYYDTYHKYMNDPRITKLGHFLRKTSLDELPQLFNVLKGDMSLVGNRPYMVTEKKKMGNFADIILATKPGITGLWQVSGRSDVSFDERLNIDSWYIKNWSLWNDIVILLKTLGVVLKRNGAS